MNITLIQATPNPIKLITDVASICYGNDEAKYPDKLLIHLFKNGHHSTFEHVYFTFKIEDISRVCLAQLTRHRHASYSVRSQRYCDEGEQRYIIPNEILQSDVAEDYHNFIQEIYTFYEEIKSKGVKKEDARFILPQAITTDLYMSMNLRELIHIFKLRTSSQAQWEIRKLLNTMVTEVLNVNPELQILFKEEE